MRVSNVGGGGGDGDMGFAVCAIDVGQRFSQSRVLSSKLELRGDGENSIQEFIYATCEKGPSLIQSSTAQYQDQDPLCACSERRDTVLAHAENQEIRP
jgi:hypothetical protein